MPMAVVTAFGTLERLGLKAEQTILIHGAGTMMGFAAVQMALLRGSRVIATAGEAFAERLRGLGATVVSYGDGMVERVLGVTGGSPDLVPDLVMDTAPASGALPALVQIAGDPKRVMTISDFAAAAELGVRSNIGEMKSIPYHVLGDFARLAAEGKVTVPIAQTYALDDWRAAFAVSQGRRAHGKLVILPGGETSTG